MEPQQLFEVSLGIAFPVAGRVYTRSQVKRALFQSHTNCVSLNQKISKQLWGSSCLLAEEKWWGVLPGVDGDSCLTPSTTASLQVFGLRVCRVMTRRLQLLQADYSLPHHKAAGGSIRLEVGGFQVFNVPWFSSSCGRPALRPY